jgi:hypothetical protein
MEDKMVYGTVRFRTKPGKRFDGIKKLVEMASWLTEKYEVNTQVMGNLTGQIYQNHVVTRYDSMSHSEEVWEKIFADPEYPEWFEQSADLLIWEGSTTNWHRIHE